MPNVSYEWGAAFRAGRSHASRAPWTIKGSCAAQAFLAASAAAAVATLAFAPPVQAQSELERGFSGALRGCEEWVLNPGSWVNGVAPFVAAVGLGDQMGLVESIDEHALPPQQLRIGNQYWRINSTPGAGYILVVSNKIPMCHITGGGDVDLQPAVESVLASRKFAARWELVKEQPIGDMASTVFRNRKWPSFSIVISRSMTPGQRLDRVQVQATAGPLPPN